MMRDTPSSHRVAGLITITLSVGIGAHNGDLLRRQLADPATLELCRTRPVGMLGSPWGAVGAIAATRVMAGVLYEVQTTEPLTCTSVTVLLGSVAFLASYLSGRRAAQLDRCRCGGGNTESVPSPESGLQPVGESLTRWESRSVVAAGGR
jgi:hypothetical protein